MRTGLVEKGHPRDVVGRHHCRPVPHPLQASVLEAAHGAHPRLLVGIHEARVDPARHAIQLCGEKEGL